MSTNSTGTAPRPPTVRAAITNGSRHFLMPGGERSVFGRRHRDIYEAITEDRGGADRLSEGERQLARRCAQLSIEAEAMEAARADGGELNLEAYIAVTNALGRALARLGIGREAIDVTPNFREYIERKT